MKTSMVLPVLLLGTVSLGFGVCAQASTDPVTGLVHGTAKVVTTVGKGGITVVKGVGQGVGAVATGVGKGTATVLHATTKAITGGK